MIETVKKYGGIAAAVTAVILLADKVRTSMPPEITPATQGYVRDTVAPVQSTADYSALNFAKRNIAWTWDKICAGPTSDRLDELYVDLAAEYRVYRDRAGVSHRYEAMNLLEVCNERDAE